MDEDITDGQSRQRGLTGSTWDLTSSESDQIAKDKWQKGSTWDITTESSVGEGDSSGKMSVAGALFFPTKKKATKMQINSIMSGSGDCGPFIKGWEEARRIAEMAEVMEYLKDPLLRGDQVLMMILNINVIYGFGRNIEAVPSFIDPGSGCCLILTKLAERLKLQGRPVTITITTVTKAVTKETKLYVVEVESRSGAQKVRIRSKSPIFGASETSG